MRIAQNIALVKPLFDGALGFLSSQPFHADPASDRQGDLAAMVDPQLLGELGSIEDANLDQIAGIE